ncbi:MAG: hypothetical protein COS68_07445 [Elusimicrobia bacterium CG06_land_8_20_14_3_00_38_11]|nr:MAG: hypothetical protein COS68_07445 [Elusimicrobia bacterium CG06_land_8_20_14_3_00_38_11]
MTNIKKQIVIIFFAGLISAPFFFYNRWQDVDFWGHLFFGKQIVETKNIPKTDFYSYTAYGNKWVNHEWLSEVIFYSTYKKFGDKGLIFLKVILGMITGGFLFSTMLIYSSNYKTLFLIYLFELPLVFLGASFRPQIFTYLYLSIFGLLLHLYKKTEKLPFLILMFPTMVLWSNSHGGFVAGLSIALILLLEKFSRKHLFVILALPLASLITPYHFNLWNAIFRAITNPLTAKYITEWGKFTISDFPLLGCLFVFIAIISAVSSLIYLFQKKYFSFLVILISILFASRYSRHIPVFAIISAPFLVPFFENIKKRSTVMILTISAFFPFFLLLFALKNPSFEITDNGRFPANAVNFLKEKKLGGNIFNEFNWGEYLIWQLYPQCKVAIDGRYDTVYPVSFLKNYFEKFETSANTDFLLLKPQRKIDVKKWREIYSDKISVLYTKKVDE